MSLICTGNRIQLTDHTDGRISFDTNRSMFHTLNFVSGSTNRSARSCVDTDQDHQVTTNLSAVNSACTHVFGWCRPVFAGGQDKGVVNGAWHAIGGTVLMFMSPGVVIAGQYRYTQTQVGKLTHIYIVTFQISGGQLQLVEDIRFMRINSADVSSGDVTGFLSFDLEYKAWCGRFDN
jgi:hypothetical protein